MYIETMHQPIFGKGSVTAYTGTAGTTGFLPEGAKAVWVLTTTAAYVTVGTSPTAASTDLPLPANIPFIIRLEQPSESLKVSAVQVSSGGNLHVMPLAS